MSTRTRRIFGAALVVVAAAQVALFAHVATATTNHPRAHRVIVTVRGRFPSTEDTSILEGHAYRSGRGFAYFVPRVLDDLTARAYARGSHHGRLRGWRADCAQLRHDG